jgi:hypothetical protein
MILIRGNQHLYPHAYSILAIKMGSADGNIIKYSHKVWLNISTLLIISLLSTIVTGLPYDEN